MFGARQAARCRATRSCATATSASRSGESARPKVLGNEIRGPGVYAVVYRDSAGGQLNDNVLADHVFGIQLSDNAAPDITNNRLQGIALTGVSYADNTGGNISGNDCGSTSGSTSARRRHQHHRPRRPQRRRQQLLAEQ